MATTIRQRPGGSLVFNSAEKLLGYSTGPADDIWAYGCTIFELFTRHPAFEMFECECPELRDYIHFRAAEVLGRGMLSQQCKASGDPEKRPTKEIEALYDKWEKKNSPTFHSLKVCKRFQTTLTILGNSW